MANDLSVIIDGLELNNPHDRYGHLEVDDIDGWWKAPSRKTRDEARQTADGDYTSIDYFEARFVTLKLAFVAKSDPDRWVGAQRLTSLLSGGPAVMSVRADGIRQWARVKLVDNGDPKWTAYRLFEMTLQVKAVDPRKYDQETEFATSAGGAAAAVYHRGDYPASPILTVTGSMPGGYRIIKGGKVISVDAALGASAHTIDLDTGILRIGGAVAVGGINRYEWDTIAPGTAQSVTIEPQTTGTATLKLAVTDTYI
ncbi:hypothetical protein [Glutamicibacter sp. X7]